MNKDEIKFILSNSPTFYKLSEEAIEELLSISQIREYQNGQIIYKQNSEADYFYFILKGKVVVYSYQEGREVEIDLLKRGTSFGIISLFTNQPHSVTTKAIEPTSILLVEKEKFKEFLNKWPNIHLDFSRMLSQRVRALQPKPKKIFQFRRIAIVGFSSSGKTTYLYSLAKTLKEVTNKKVIGVEISLSETFGLPFYLRSEQKVFPLSKLDCQDIKDKIISAEADYLLLKMDKKGLFSNFLSLLSEEYHFIVYEIPFILLDEEALEFIEVADWLDFLLFSQIEELKKARMFIEQLKERYTFLKDKIRILINEFGAKDNLLSQDICKILNQPIYATLPSYNALDYAKAIKRIARQTGEVVVGLALGSGAAYGFSHIGVLEVLERERINIDIICGSSMGAFIASLWALGYSIKEIEELSKRFTKLLMSFSILGIRFPYKGLIRAKHLEKVCKKIFGNKTFFDIKRTLKIVAFDFLKRQTAVLESGLIYKAVAASCAIPGIFEPVKFQNELLLDGGILNPLPTRVLFSYNVNTIIAVNIAPSKEKIYKEYAKKYRHNVFEFIFGSVESMQQEFVTGSLALADVVIQPNLEGIGWMEFGKISDLIRRGQIATEEKLEELKKLV